MNGVIDQRISRPNTIQSRSMPRFVAIDGLRAWMAWVVVASHVVQQGLSVSGIDLFNRFDPGGQAVNAFIIISGFVITHLLIERPGPYLSYLIPRFMRLFPAFFVCCAIGQITYMIASHIGSAEWFEPLHGANYRALMQYYPEQAIAHLTMLHGILPNSILPFSQYTFNTPGWSVSLEWQFYLIAPGVIWLTKNSGRAMILIIVIIICTLCYHESLKPLWDRPSFIVGTAKMFLIGIACRLAAPALAGLVSHVAPVGLGIGFTLLWVGSPAIAVWLIVYTFMLRKEGYQDWVDQHYVATLTALLESSWIQFLAERSYSTYLLHWPVLTLIGAVATANGFAPGVHLASVMLLVVPLTLVLQEPIYRFVEMPGRAIGKQWAIRYGARPIREQSFDIVPIPPEPFQSKRSS